MVDGLTQNKSTTATEKLRDEHARLSHDKYCDMVPESQNTGAREALWK
jgi:hypothetical protein